MPGRDAIRFQCGENWLKSKLLKFLNCQMSTNLEQVHRAAPTKQFSGCFFPLAHSTFRIVAICVLNCRKCGRTEASSAFALGAPFLIRLWPYLVFSKN